MIKFKRWYPAETVTDKGYTDDVALFANTPVQAKFLWNSLKQAARSIGLHVSTNKTKFMCFKQGSTISTLCDKPLKLVHQFPYLSSNISSTESGVNISLVKAWSANDRLLFTWKYDLFDRIKYDFFQAAAAFIEQYGC